MLLVYFELQFELHPVGLILTGALAATSGRAVLAYGMRRIAHRLPARYVSNMDSAGRYFTRNKALAFGTVATFFFSPLSSAQLFAAAGIMRNIALQPLLAMFLVSKVILPEAPQEKIEFVEIEAIYSKKTRQIPWRNLMNSEEWLQGWK